MEDRLLYRVTEVAVFLNVSRSKVYELLASGDLRSVKIDRTRLVRGSDLRDYVESLRPVACDTWGGFIWVSWPKKSAKVATDIIEDTIREVILPDTDLVDVKVCAVDDIWSGLKLMRRRT